MLVTRRHTPRARAPAACSCDAPSAYSLVGLAYGRSPHSSLFAGAGALFDRLRPRIPIGLTYRSASTALAFRLRLGEDGNLQCRHSGTEASSAYPSWSFSRRGNTSRSPRYVQYWKNRGHNGASLNFPHVPGAVLQTRGAVQFGRSGAREPAAGGKSSPSNTRLPFRCGAASSSLRSTTEGVDHARPRWSGSADVWLAASASSCIMYGRAASAEASKIIEIWKPTLMPSRFLSAARG